MRGRAASLAAAGAALVLTGVPAVAQAEPLGDGEVVTKTLSAGWAAAW